MTHKQIALNHVFSRMPTYAPVDVGKIISINGVEQLFSKRVAA